ncbi:MAG: hypothetical protein OXC05_08370 [Halieaceae bacterium]|nr:hypothetical protein [Halieaceae bacterium]
MIIVVIHWKIKRKQKWVDKFLEFWRKTATVEDRSGLIGEFLSEGHSTAEFDWITWPLTGCEEKYRSFVNVGFWNSAEEFQEQIGKYFKPSGGLEKFEAKPRQRTALKPKCWRVGDNKLPIHDSGGVL